MKNKYIFSGHQLMSAMRNPAFARIFSLSLLFSISFQLFVPTPAQSQTSGSSSAEFSAGGGGDDMVDLFSGDFNYSIPLMTVPGPNGSFPIAINYSSSGINMESEASWVGLGWNLNMGAIERNVKGLPDDYNGDIVTKSLEMKNVEHIALGWQKNIFGQDLKKEFFGFEASLGYGFNPQLYYNNYSGFGYRFGFSLFPAIGLEGEKTTWAGERLGGTLSLSYDSQKGYGFSAESGFSSIFGQISKGINLQHGSGLQSYSSLTTFLNYSFDRNNNKLNYVPGNFYPFEMSSFNFHLQGGSTNGGVTEVTSYNASALVQRPKSSSHGIPGYGYLYNENSSSESLKDINRENDIPTTENSPSLAIPVAQPDDYTITGNMQMAIRPFRSDIGIYSEEAGSSSDNGNGFGFEWATGTTAAVGTDVQQSSTDSYSGVWLNGLSQINHLVFQPKSTSTPLYEPYYFKSLGETTLSDKEILDATGGYQPVAFAFGYNGSQPTVWNRLSPLDEADPGITNGKRTNREVRETAILTFTKAEMEANEFWGDRSDTIWTSGNKHDNPTSGTRFTFPAEAQDHHIGKMNVLSSDGTTYVYGLPVYVKQHDEVIYSSGQNGSDSYENPAVRAIVESSGEPDHDQGKEELFLKTSLSPYVSTYLITEMHSHDYVDLTGDGATFDDLGFYVKFNYTRKYSEFNWRSPYMDSYCMNGHLSDVEDDKASYKFGTKEIYYVNAVETKTHIAVFEISDRQDAAEPEDEFNDKEGDELTTPDKLQKLDRIVLYSKATNEVLQTVEFIYDYSLCDNWVANTEVTTGLGDNTLSNAGGKLTLKKIIITNLENSKGELTPYEFTYNASNPNYSTLKMDRWGTTYTTATSSTFDWDELENQYQLQVDYNKDGTNDGDDFTDLTANVSAWLLTSIHQPTGSDIDVVYEPDDYAYVQDKRAQQMMRILGTSEETEDGPVVPGEIKRKDLRIYFELEDLIPVPAGGSPELTAEVKSQVYNYIAGISQVYFKTFQRLRNRQSSSVMTYDYVKGYAEVDFEDDSKWGVDPDFITVSGDDYYNIGYFTVKTKTYGVTSTDVNPFRIAGWQYIRSERSDLDENTLSGNAVSIAASLIQAVANLPQLFGYYNSAAIKGWDREIYLDQTGMEPDPKPSYVRLNSPDYIKTGGGHRVKSITFTDNWDENNSSYTKEYSYRLADGKSSGVCAYEPISGGDENAMKVPHWYNPDNNFVYKNDKTFLEGPWNESEFPAPGVGYSRVLIRTKNNAGETINQNNTGVTEYQHYTYKDFPIISLASQLQAQDNTEFSVIPLRGYSFDDRISYSQGFYLENNDMHGRLKSVATYRYTTGEPTDLVTKSEYIYHTDLTGKKLENEVTVLTGDAITEEATLGEFYDFYIDAREHSSTAENRSVNANITVTGTVVIPSLWWIDGMESLQYNAITTNKIVYKKGILEKVKTYDQGTYTESENLMYDPQTGEALLTTTLNSFKNPVYNYSYAAHWQYEGMRGAWQNLGAEVLIASHGGSGATLTDANLYFFPGDVVQVVSATTNEGNIYYVNSVSSTNVTLQDKAGDEPTMTSERVKIIRSGYRNLQSARMGTIISLQNPVTERPGNIFELYNQQITGQTLADPQTAVLQDVKVCGSEELEDVTVTIDGDELTFSYVDGGVCSMTCTFDREPASDDLSDYEFTGYTLEHGGAYLHDIPNNTDYEMILNEGKDCFTGCFTVLHADAVEYQEDGWIYNYFDAGDPEIESAALLRTATVNSYAYGQRGVWRILRNNLFLVQRLQSGTTPTFKTEIDKDGEYNQFEFFNWGYGAIPSWTSVSEITKYNPYGYALETQDKLGIYAAKMYSHYNTVVAASAANSDYMEMAFDGFEDYGTLTSYPSGTGHGHLDLEITGGGDPDISDEESHTGKKSIVLNDPTSFVATVNQSSPNFFRPKASQQYIVSAWFRETGTDIPEIVVRNGSSVVISTSYAPSDYPVIEGWRKVDVIFTAPASGNITIEFSCDSNTFLDDIRIHPFKSAMVSAVYDPLTRWKVADLDNQNFATFYNYDEEGQIVQVKKETIKGIMTISTGRTNIIRQ